MGVWQDIWNVVLSEFSDIPHAVEAARITLRILIASILGGLLGFEREARGKAAGLRTHMLVALGAAIFVLVPQQAGASGADLSRVLQGLVAGVGIPWGRIHHNGTKKGCCGVDHGGEHLDHGGNRRGRRHGAGSDGRPEYSLSLSNLVFNSYDRAVGRIL